MAAPAQQMEPTQPKTALDEQIAQVVREMLSEQGKQTAAARVSAESSFERDLGLGSLDLVELVVRCEARLEIAVPDEVAEQADTPAGWAKAILQGGEEAAKSVYRIVPPPAEVAVAPTEARTLVDVLRWRAQTAPDRIVLHIVGQGGGFGRTGAQLLEAAELIARGLISQGVRAQDRVALLLPTGIDFFEAFLAVQLAGATPVPLYGMANAGRLDEYANQQGAILRETGATALIAGVEQRGLSRILRALAPDLMGAFEPGLLRAEGKRTWVDLPGPTLAAPAFIQFTAGVTGLPKAIATSHETLLSDLQAVGERLELQGGDGIATCLATAGGWGLTVWQLSIYYGLPLTYLAPQEFAERPETWLWAIHNSRSTISAAPNSAYDACARRIPMWTLEGLDLSRWRCAILAGELVLPGTVAAFTRRFAGFGFRQEALRTAYGVAEAGVLTLAQAGNELVADDDGFFPVGEVLPGHDVRAVEGQVEFRLAGTRAWVGTGDLGYFREGRLVVTGRSKEALHRDGVSPYQLEAAAGAVAGIAAGAVAAFAVREGPKERLVLAAESAAAHSSSAGAVIALLRRTVQAKTGTQLDEIVLAAPGTLPRTGDRRIRRLPARELYLQGRLGQAPGSALGAQLGLWLNHLPALAQLGTRSLHQRIDSRFRRWQAASAAGVAPLTAARARRVLEHLGQEAVIEGELVSGTLVVVHRCGPLDPIAFAAFSRVPLRFAGASVLNGTPEWLHPCLRPLIAQTEAEMRQAMEQGVLVQFPDNDLGEPVARCRFRLPPFRVASLVVPSVVQQLRRTTTIRFAKAMPPEADATATRELTRAVLGRLRTFHPHA